MKAYLFWYKNDEYAPTEYVYIIALSYKQANYFWYNYLHNVLGYVYDYDTTPCNVMQCTRPHDVGDILGQNARI